MAVEFETIFAESRWSVRYRDDFKALLAAEVARLPSGATVAELGAGANPVLADDARVRAGDLDYLRVDISSEELAKGNAVGTAVTADVAGDHFALDRPVDLAFSQMLAEHVPSGAGLLRNVFDMLRPGGTYIQVSPVLYALPFVFNKLIPETTARKALARFAPRDQHQRAKFPAVYSMCRPPTRAHLRRLESFGFEVVLARAYFGHTYYKRVRWLHRLEAKKATWLREHPVPLLAAYAVYVLRRPV